MKLLYNLLFLLSVIQWVQTKSLENSASSTTPDEQLAVFYDTETNLLAGDIVNKLKTFSEQIVKDELVQHSLTSLMMDLKRNLTVFQEIYPFYIRFGLNRTLSTTLFDIINAFDGKNLNNDTEFLHLLELKRKLGYDAILEKFTKALETFVHEKFEAKFEELRAKITNRDQLVKFNDKFSICIAKLKECVNYKCYLNVYKNTFLSAKDKFIGSVQRQLLSKAILLSKNESIAANNLLENPQFKQLNPDIRQKITEKIQNFTRTLDVIDYPADVISFAIYHPWLIFFPGNEKRLPAKDRQIHEELLENYAFSSVDFNVELISNNFTDFSKEFEKFKNSMTAEELAKEKYFISNLNDLLKAETTEQKLLIIQETRLVHEEEFLNRRI